MTRQALDRWQPHPSRSLAQPALQHWLTLDTSLTAALRARCQDFRVQLLNQCIRPCLPDEYAAIGLPRRLQVHTRDVLLCCDGLPVVFAHTVVPGSASAADWPIFRKLGERSLGSLLFGDPQVVREALQFSHLPPMHRLMRQICGILPQEQLKSRLHARRCRFRRKRGLMLVTEVFLPSILTLTE